MLCTVLSACEEDVGKGPAGHALLSKAALCLTAARGLAKEGEESNYFWLELVNKAAC